MARAKPPKSKAPKAPVGATPELTVPTAQAALAEGVVDAIGFVGGALLGWQWGRWLGFDVLAPGEWTSRSLIGWALLLAGCGLGKWVSLQWRRQRARRLAATKIDTP